MIRATRRDYVLAPADSLREKREEVFENLGERCDRGLLHTTPYDGSKHILGTRTPGTAGVALVCLIKNRRLVLAAAVAMDALQAR